MNEIQNAILALKKEKNALILAHYYQRPDVQEVADHVCDSFEMARLASGAKEELLVICGVKFMAESAKAFNPDKTVLLPSPDAGCPMADMVTPGDIEALRERYPDAAVVCYVNTSCAVKAVCDICCTSSSAESIVRSLPEKRVIFIPDRNLGAYVAARVPEKEMILFDGCCPIHDRIVVGDVIEAKATHPDAKLLVHPECRKEVLQQADYIGSTAGMIKEALDSSASEFIIGTEMEVAERLRGLAPHKKFYTVVSGFECADMKKIQLPDVLKALEKNEYQVTLDPEESRLARRSLERMIGVH